MGHIESAHFYPPKVSKNGSHCLTTQKIKIGTCTHALCTYTHALHTNLALHQLRCIILNYFECLQVHAQKMFLPFPQMDRRASIIFEKIHKTHTRTYLAHLSCTDTVTNICTPLAYAAICTCPCTRARAMYLCTHQHSFTPTVTCAPYSIFRMHKHLHTSSPSIRLCVQSTHTLALLHLCVCEQS